MQSFKELIVWQKAMSLVEEVYKLMSFLPANEKYALSDKIRRAVVSIPSNIAEGRGRNSEREFAYFLNPHILTYDPFFITNILTIFTN